MFDWKLALKDNLMGLRYLGLWPKEGQTYRVNYYTLYAILLLVVLMFGQTSFQTINLYFLLSDLKAFSATTAVVVSCQGATLKAYALVRNMKTLREVFLSLNTNILQPKNDEQKQIIQDNINTWRRLYQGLRGVYYVAAIYLAISPVLDKSYKEYNLPYIAWYPYNLKTFPNYELTYFYQVLALFVTVRVNLNIDMLIAALGVIIGTQCDLLCNKLRNIAGEKAYDELIKSIEHHREIKRIAQKCNDFFQWIVFMQFFSSAISIGLSLFMLSVSAPFSGDFNFYLLFACSALFEILIFCWFGNEVEYKSRQIPGAALECNWLQAPSIMKKTLIFMTLNTTKPIKFSAMNLFYLSVGTFLAILRTSWSYFTLLTQMSRK